MSRRLVMGDVHGAYKAMRQVLERASFDPSEDILYFVGDVCDGWPDTYECIDYLSRLAYLNYTIGNHDLWLLEWFKTAASPSLWTNQGGSATLDSYARHYGLVPEAHIRLLERAAMMSVATTHDNRLVVHGGIDPSKSLIMHSREELVWDRSLHYRARDGSRRGKDECKITSYDAVYTGHTSTHEWSAVPVKCCDVWLLDQGAGWTGKLSVLDMDTEEFWQSDAVPTLYPTEYYQRIG